MKKIVIISAIMIICVFGVVAAASIYLLKSYTADNAKEKGSNSELVNDNSDAINSAKKIQIKTVKGILPGDHYQGKLDAPVQMIVYSDFECPVCLDYENSVKQVKESFGDKIVIAFRHYPLSYHANAQEAAQASECAGEQGKFWEMHDMLFKNNLDQALSREQFEQDAKDIGLDVQKFSQCLVEEKYKEKVYTDMIEGKTFGVSGTPSTFINGQYLPGAYPLEDFTDSEGIRRSGLKTTIESVLK